jgi:hypothetical protein
VPGGDCVCLARDFFVENASTPSLISPADVTGKPVAWCRLHQSAPSGAWDWELFLTQKIEVGVTAGTHINDGRKVPGKIVSVTAGVIQWESKWNL